MMTGFQLGSHFSADVFPWSVNQEILILCVCSVLITEEGTFLFAAVKRFTMLSPPFFPKTVCVEKNETLGGTCLNVGCIPSKVRVHCLS